MGKVFIFYYFYIPISEGTSPSEAIEGLLRRWSKRDESLFWADVWGFSQAGSKWLLASVCPSSVRPSVEGPEYRSLKAFWGIGDWETYFRNVGGLGDWKNGGIGDWELGIDRLGIQGLEYWMSMNDCWYGIGRDGRDHKSTTNDYFSNSSPFDIYIYIFIIIIFFFYYSFFFFFECTFVICDCVSSFFFFFGTRMWSTNADSGLGSYKCGRSGHWNLGDLDYRSLQNCGGLGIGGLKIWNIARSKKGWGIGVLFFFSGHEARTQNLQQQKKKTIPVFFFSRKRDNLDKKGTIRIKKNKILVNLLKNKKPSEKWKQYFP